MLPLCAMITYTMLWSCNAAFLDFGMRLVDKHVPGFLAAAGFFCKAYIVGTTRIGDFCIPFGSKNVLARSQASADLGLHLDFRPGAAKTTSAAARS